ncbi:hypothetical protein BDR06DRAFT_985654 [Suillus hirtellus]|nr:hypothetical protein BDR06DRAFT_985654 [Suillus hirtellus]
MSEHVIVVHGDLLIKERLDIACESCCIEDTPKNHLQFIVFLPGLFHYKMACTDTLWRIHVQPKHGRDDEVGMFKHICILRPSELNTIGSKPGFQQMHDVIHHDLWAAMLDCWHMEVSTHHSQWTSLDKFAESDPKWDDIVEISMVIISKAPSDQRDQAFENQILWNQDELLYVDLCDAMNASDVGRVEASFLPWIYIFKAVGKHKYAVQVSHFCAHLHYGYPEGLQKIIYLNMLCNPTGKAHAFLIYSGTGPNHTIDHIINESPLIEVYQNYHITIENAFHLSQCTIRHAPPNMTKTIQKLIHRMVASSPHQFAVGRTTKHVIDDKLADGVMLLQKGAGLLPGNEDDEAAQIEADDLWEN